MKHNTTFRPKDISNDSYALSERRKKRTALGDDLWVDLGKGYEFMPVLLGGVQLWNPVIRAVGRKTIVETPMVERKGSVKEIISQDDYIINIKGIIKRYDGQWPDEELAQLVDLYERNEAIAIHSALTGRLLNGHEYVVIKSLELPDKPGYTESLEYTIECISDIPFELIIDGNL